MYCIRWDGCISWVLVIRLVVIKWSDLYCQFIVRPGIPEIRTHRWWLQKFVNLAISNPPAISNYFSIPLRVLEIAGFYVLATKRVVSRRNFACSLARKITWHCMKNLALHSVHDEKRFYCWLSKHHFSISLQEGRENCTFLGLGVKGLIWLKVWDRSGRRRTDYCAVIVTQAAVLAGSVTSRWLKKVSLRWTKARNALDWEIEEPIKSRE